MAISCRAAFLHAALLGLTTDVLGGVSQSFRGTRIPNIAMSRLDEKLSEADFPGMYDSAEMADSDENDDVEDGTDEEQGEEQGSDHADAIEHLTRISRIVDADSDGTLSSQELVAFANRLRSKQRWDHTRSALAALDSDGDGQVAHAELDNRVSSPAKSNDNVRFAAADWNGDGLLNETEFHAFAYPVSHDMVLKVETMHHFEIFDKDRDNRISFEEFIKDNKHVEDFSHDAAHEDYHLHDIDGSGYLDADEFQRLLAGHDLLADSVVKAISAVDSDGDGQISISEEVPNGIHGLLDSEYIEDFFYHEYISGHQEL
jgi:Ca2+-binding EF-hand superfamily protein